MSGLALIEQCDCARKLTQKNVDHVEKTENKSEIWILKKKGWRKYWKKESVHNVMT